ncbi:probable LRR receptor-like serine/threonine-protein kinase At3g47570 [Brassica napus]|uniref:probable LRR receptor-like serine/threonine-protein kinase At3g47570 n=1 Tax=Brassica napus TaxID=3708 RepID=UPI0020785630|nr:probable LRR receptor-like serine/threonine-protein kinase At3g47570 [Brassica napus]
MRLFLLFSFSALMLHEAYGFTDEPDRKALLDFKSQVSEENQDALSSWNNSSPLCNWKGVTCGLKNKRVTRLNLGGCQLRGMISPSIGNISFLISLNLSDNSIGGTIPYEVGNLFRLKYLNISFNFLEGEIPDNLFNCSRLLDLDLWHNHLGGGVPSELESLEKLETLDFGANNLRGKLPASLGNLTSLARVSFSKNNLEGRIPDDLARLTQLVHLGLGENKFSGGFPPSIYNFSSLEYLNMFGNVFSGSLKPDFGNLLPKLRLLEMGTNSFTGPIPTTLSNISNLQEFSIEQNKMTGSISSSFGKLKNLKTLRLHNNSLGSYSSGDLEFLKALSNCTQLQTLLVNRNRLGGVLPTSITNLSTNLWKLDLGTNFIFGTIPYGIGNLVSLQKLVLRENLLTGPLPSSIGKLSRLVFLNLTSNRMSGEIPSSIGNITWLEKLNLSNNSFEGTIPPSLGQCKYILYFRIGSNKLNGTIPQEIMQIQSLVYLDLSNNSLTGSLPEYIKPLERLCTLSVAHNKLYGHLPQVLGNCLSLENLYLQGNFFYGDIPNIKGLMGAKILDFSNNDFSGSIPGYFGNFSLLEYLNLSINNFEGEVPTEGKFRNATVVLVFGNKYLCGGIKELKLNQCIVQAQPSHSSGSKKVTIELSIGIALLLMVLIMAYISLCWFRKIKNNQLSSNSTSSSTREVVHEKISYAYLRNATDGFSSSNLIGSGSFGTVFKAFLPTENKVVAVKVLNLQRRGAMKSFLTECESLKDIRHRNLVKLLTACSSTDLQGNDFRALIYELMPNGSLDMWLHPEEVEEIRRPSRTLTLFERLNIAVDVISVLEYLHVYCHEPIAHCDLKPSNVLLDKDLTGHVSDFGIARLLMKLDQESFFNHLSSAGVRGTIGYAPPEYGMGGQPSIYGDVYSFGVLLLEMFTGKRPTNDLFGGNVTLNSYIKLALPERVLDIADNSILNSGLRAGFPLDECLIMVFKVGLRCCEESPKNRLATSEARKELILIRERFFIGRR